MPGEMASSWHAAHSGSLAVPLPTLALVLVDVCLRATITQIYGVLPCSAGGALMQGQGRGQLTCASLLLSLQLRCCRSALQAVLSNAMVAATVDMCLVAAVRQTQLLLLCSAGGAVSESHGPGKFSGNMKGFSAG